MKILQNISPNYQESVKDWEIIHRNLKKRGWSLGSVSVFDSERRTIWIVDAHRDDGKRFIVSADEKLTPAAVSGYIIRGLFDKLRPLQVQNG